MLLNLSLKAQDERYQGVCDKDGCDFNSFRLGDTDYYGRGKSFDVNSRIAFHCLYDILFSKFIGRVRAVRSVVTTINYGVLARSLDVQGVHEAKSNSQHSWPCQEEDENRHPIHHGRKYRWWRSHRHSTLLRARWKGHSQLKHLHSRGHRRFCHKQGLCRYEGQTCDPHIASCKGFLNPKVEPSLFRCERGMTKLKFNLLFRGVCWCKALATTVCMTRGCGSKRNHRGSQFFLFFSPPMSGFEVKHSKTYLDWSIQSIATWPPCLQSAFGDPDDFTRLGGLKAMGEALNRGMVLVMSLWDDAEPLEAEGFSKHTILLSSKHIQHIKSH